MLLKTALRQEGVWRGPSAARDAPLHISRAARIGAGGTGDRIGFGTTTPNLIGLPAVSLMVLARILSTATNGMIATRYSASSGKGFLLRTTGTAGVMRGIANPRDSGGGITDTVAGTAISGAWMWYCVTADLRLSATTVARVYTGRVGAMAREAGYTAQSPAAGTSMFDDSLTQFQIGNAYNGTNAFSTANLDVALVMVLGEVLDAYELSEVSRAPMAYRDRALLLTAPGLHTASAFDVSRGRGLGTPSGTIGYFSGVTLPGTRIHSAWGQPATNITGAGAATGVATAAGTARLVLRAAGAVQGTATATGAGRRVRRADGFAHGAATAAGSARLVLRVLAWSAVGTGTLTYTGAPPTIPSPWPVLTGTAIMTGSGMLRVPLRLRGTLRRTVDVDDITLD